MKGFDPEGQLGPRKPLPDFVQIIDPPVDKIVSEPSSEQREPAAIPATVPPAEESAAYQPQEGYQQPEAFVEQPVF
jgi:small subunit ribosomal protein S3e